MPSKVIYRTSSNEVAQVFYDQWMDSFQLYAVGAGEDGKQYYRAVHFSRAEFKQFLEKVNKLESETDQSTQSDKE